MQSAQYQLHAQIEERHWWFVARRRILRELVRKVSPPAGDHASVLVDIGCGTGANLAAFADDYRCVGIDTSAEAVELARDRFPAATFICGHAPRDVDHWLATASVVLLTDVLEHVANDRGLLESIVGACSPCAHLVITVPADMRLWSPHDETFGHFRRYDREGFAKLWAGLPVRPRLISHFNSRLYPLVRMARRFHRWRGQSNGEANTDFKLPTRPVNRLLESIFAAERSRLRKTMDGGGNGFRRGVSLIAVLERLPSQTTGLKEGDCCDAEFSASMPLEPLRL